jgi:hypothetical protein
MALHGKHNPRNDRIIQFQRLGNRLDVEVVTNGTVIQRNRLGIIDGQTLVIDFVLKARDGGVQLPSIPCPKCWRPMKHYPNLFSNWLPNGIYTCQQCGFQWWGTPGLVDNSP